MKMWNDFACWRKRFIVSRRSIRQITSVRWPGSTLITNFDSDWNTRYRPMPAPPEASDSCSGPFTRQRFR